jgi:hypothetical protein
MNDKFTLMHGMEHTKFMNTSVFPCLFAIPLLTLCAPEVCLWYDQQGRHQVSMISAFISDLLNSKY